MPISESFLDLNAPQNPAALATSSSVYDQLELNFPPVLQMSTQMSINLALAIRTTVSKSTPPLTSSEGQGFLVLYFSGLNPLTEYSISLQAIDSTGNISGTTEFKGKTSSMGPVDQATPSVASGTVLYKIETVELQAMAGATMCSRTDGQPATCDEQANCLSGSTAVTSLFN